MRANPLTDCSTEPSRYQSPGLCGHTHAPVSEQKHTNREKWRRIEKWLQINLQYSKINRNIQMCKMKIHENTMLQTDWQFGWQKNSIIYMIVASLKLHDEVTIASFRVLSKILARFANLSGRYVAGALYTMFTTIANHVSMHKISTKHK